MNKHIQNGKETPLPGKPYARERPMREGAYSIQRMLRAKLFDVDGLPILGKARVIMGEDGRPERLVLSGAVPESDIVEAKTKKGAYHIQLGTAKERNGKDELRIRMTKPCGPDFEYELEILSAMRVSGETTENPLGWENIAEEVGIDGVVEELEKIAREMARERKVPVREEILSAEFRFNDGVQVKGAELFGNGMAIVKEGMAKVGKREYLALQVKGDVRALIAQCSLTNLTDFGPAFVNVVADPNAFTVEIGGKVYSGKIY